uniref:RNA binding motif protein 34 n=1 Tax=Sander lucioperca TaxID=283035 RepID=A0A8D0AHU7_SANLU
NSVKAVIRNWTPIISSPYISWVYANLCGSPPTVHLSLSLLCAGFREISLQNADEEEEGGPGKKRKSSKRKAAAEPGGESEAEQWVMKRQRLKARKEEEEMKRKRTVFVGNLPISCTRKVRTGHESNLLLCSVCPPQVREDPAMSRKVAAIQRKVHPKKQSMNAYVVFKDEDGVSRANGMEIEKDFHIRVDRVTDNSAHDHKRSVFVGNLSFEIKELTFRRHFEKCGPVEAVRLVRDQNSGLGKGFGYVLFESVGEKQQSVGESSREQQSVGESSSQ